MRENNCRKCRYSYKHKIYGLLACHMFLAFCSEKNPYKEECNRYKRKWWTFWVK